MNDLMLRLSAILAFTLIAGKVDSEVTIVESMMDVFSSSKDAEGLPTTKNIRQTIALKGATGFRDAANPPLTQEEMGEFANAILKFEAEQGRSLRLYDDYASFILNNAPSKEDGTPIIDGKTFAKRLQDAASIGQGSVSFLIDGVDLGSVAIAPPMAYDIGYVAKHGGFAQLVSSLEMGQKGLDLDRPRSDYSSNCRDVEMATSYPEIYNVQNCNFAGQLKATEDFNLP